MRWCSASNRHRELSRSKCLTPSKSLKLIKKQMTRRLRRLSGGCPCNGIPIRIVITHFQLQPSSNKSQRLMKLWLTNKDVRTSRSMVTQMDVVPCRSPLVYQNSFLSLRTQSLHWSSPSQCLSSSCQVSSFIRIETAWTRTATRSCEIVFATIRSLLMRMFTSSSSSQSYRQLKTQDKWTSQAMLISKLWVKPTISWELTWSRFNRRKDRSRWPMILKPRC